MGAGFLADCEPIPERQQSTPVVDITIDSKEPECHTE